MAKTSGSSMVVEDRAARQARRVTLERELERIVERLAVLDPDRVILFGSLASGDVGRGSDIDLIVVKRTAKRFLDRLDEVYAAVEPAVGLDVLVYTPEEFETLSRERGFVSRAVATGRVLYERADPAIPGGDASEG